MQSFLTKINTFIQTRYPIIFSTLITIQAMLLFFMMMTHTKLFLPIFLLFIVFLVLFAYTKEEMNEDETSRYLWYVLASFVLLLLSIVHYGFSSFYWFIYKTTLNIEKASSLANMAYLIDAAVLALLFYFYQKEETKTFLTQIKETSWLEKLKLKKEEEEELQPGDVILCVNKDTNKPVVLLNKDRFLHMLILGATGSGKTSQTIIPMINQDIQNMEAGITVIEPKGDLAEKVHAMAEHYGRECFYFNPTLPNCPYFNPLYGKEEDVIENMATTFKMLSPDSSQFFLDQNEQLLRKGLKVLKRTLGNKATLIDLDRLLSNTNGIGKKMVNDFSRLKTGEQSTISENLDIASWFLNEYYNEKSKTYEHCSGLRSQVSKLTSNKYLRKVLNPPNGENDVDFDKSLKNGEVIAIATGQDKLRDLSRYLGFFIILQFQSAVFRRDGNENTRRHHFLYIDEFQVYANPGFADMLTQGRSYRVASHLATQNRALIGMGQGQTGKDFIELVSTNARNLVIYPGGNPDDAEYFSKQFGEYQKVEEEKGISRKQFSIFTMFQSPSGTTESIRETKKMEPLFSASDIIYRDFGEVIYRIIRKNSVQLPDVGKISYIPKELNDKLDEMVEEYKQSLFKKEEKQIEEQSSQEEKPSEFKDIVIQEDIVEKKKEIETVDKKKKNQWYDEKNVIKRDEEFQDDLLAKEVVEEGFKPQKTDEKPKKIIIEGLTDVEDDYI